MLPTARLSPRTKAGLAVALAFLLWAPQGISQETSPVVTGHSVFYNGEVYDQCLASIAGILRSRVMWFNDQVLVERYPGKGNFIFVTEAGTPDPSEQPYLISEGVRFNFTDPNGAYWVVEELVFPKPQPSAVAEDDSQEINHPNVRAGVQLDKTYTWVVELAAEPIYDRYPGEDYPHSVYNFVALVDTCKFHNNTRTYTGYVDHTNTSILNEDHGHPNNDTGHHHQSWNANLWFGKRPTIVHAVDTGDHTFSATGWAGVEDDPDRPQADEEHHYPYQ